MSTVCNCTVAFRPNIGTDKSAALSGATLRNMHSRHLPNSNSLYVEHHTEMQLVPFLKSLV